MGFRLRVNEAIARSEMNGAKVFKKEIASRLFPGATEVAQQVNMSNLCTGRTKRILPEWIPILCEMLNCSANFLFGIGED